MVYFEFYSRWERDAPWDMLAKAGLLSRRAHLPTVCIAIVFKPRGYRPQNGTFQLEAAGGPTQQLWLREICLWQTKPEPWWEEQPGLMALYPLCQHEKQPRKAIQYAAAAIERKVPLPGPRDEALALLTIFGEFAFPSLDVERIIGSEKMQESKLFRRLMAAGELAARRQDLLKVVRRFFGEQFANEVAPAISALDDLARLDQLFDGVVLQGMSKEALRATLATTTQTA